MPTMYADEYKKAVIARYENGEQLTVLSETEHIALSTLYRWRKSYHIIATDTRTYTPAEFDALTRRLRKLEHQLEIIRLSKYVDEVELKKKLAFLEQTYQQYEQYSVHELCEAMGVARGTFYNHIFRRADPTTREKEQLQLMHLVKQAFDDSSQRYGAEKIRIVLANVGIHTSKKRISAIMKELNLESVRQDAKKEYQKRQEKEKKAKKVNLLMQDFSAERPNQIWVSYFTYFKLNGQWLFFCIVLDLYSRKIIGYQISRNSSTNLVTTAFKKAFAARGEPMNLIFHSDRGKQYTSAAFMALMKKCGAKQSFSASGKPHDNAVSETFFATFKKEEAYRREYTSEQSFRKSVEQYIQFYNTSRPHQTLKYMTPDAYEKVFYEKT